MLGNEASISARGTIKYVLAITLNPSELSQTLLVVALDRPPTDHHATFTPGWCCLTASKYTHQHAYRPAYQLVTEPASAQRRLVMVTLALDRLPTD
jgi:hypothetical protein